PAMARRRATRVGSTASAGQVRVSTAQAQAGPAAAWPPVAAVIATRDRPELLERAIGGVLSQSYPGEIECLVVFDQSAPRQVGGAETADRRLRVLSNTRTPGLAGARNTGITASGAP